MVPQCVRNPHGASCSKSSARVDSLLSRVGANTFLCMEKNKIPRSLPKFCLSPFLKMVTSWASFQSAGTFKFSQMSFMMV